MKFIISCLVSYFLGTIPTAFLLGKMIKGIDIRKYGSGNVGATNAFRVIGKTAGLTALFFDILKGFIAVYFIPKFFYSPEMTINYDLFRVLMSIAVIFGHLWPVYLNFKGGKGVATTAGVLIVLSPKALLIGFIIWIIVFIFSRYVSLASIVAAFCLPLVSLVINDTIYIFSFLVITSIIGIYKHKTNIGRLLSGKEKKLL